MINTTNYDKIYQNMIHRWDSKLLYFDEIDPPNCTWALLLPFAPKSDGNLRSALSTEVRMEVLRFTDSTIVQRVHDYMIKLLKAEPWWRRIEANSTINEYLWVRATEPRWHGTNIWPFPWLSTKSSPQEAKSVFCQIRDGRWWQMKPLNVLVSQGHLEQNEWRQYWWRCNLADFSFSDTHQRFKLVRVAGEPWNYERSRNIGPERSEARELV